MLKINNLTVARGEITILRNIFLNVTENTFISVVGSNGAGKSSLLDTIIGMNRKLEGNIYFLDQEISSLKTNEIIEKGIILVPEGKKVFRNMTVMDNLLVGGAPIRAKYDRQKNFDLVINLFPVLGERRKQLAGTLSGGELQMLAIGCGLMGKPILLMLDELSIGIAPILVKEIYYKIKSLKEGGLTVLVVEQNVKLSLEISDYAYVLENGSITLEGDSIGLVNNPHIKEAFLGL